MKIIGIVIFLTGVLAWAGPDTNHTDSRELMWGAARDLPAGLEVSLVADRTNYFLGENVLLHFRIYNASGSTFKISVGGDYRGSTRADRLEVKGISASGKPVADPTPFMQNFGGGLMPGGEIHPGGEWFEEVWVNEYCRFDAPGTYAVHAFHDLGFGERKPADRREASCTIQLRAPSEIAAERILAEAERAKPYSGNTWGKKGEARIDYHCIRWPTFLKPLQKRAWVGNEAALEGITNIRTLEATRALVELLEHTNLVFAAKAAQALEVRLPHPASDFKAPWGEQRRQFIIEGAWEKKLGPPVRECCVRLLTQTNRSSLLTASSLLRLIGTASELPALRRALVFAVAQTNAEFLADVHYPAPIRACDALVGVMLGIDPKLGGQATVNSAPDDLVLYLARHGGITNHLTSLETTVFDQAMHHTLAFVRMKALENLPETIPANLTAPITGCLMDSNVGVQNYAFHAAKRMQVAAHREIALTILRSAQDHWLRASAQQIALKYDARYECALAWCVHLVAPINNNDYTPHDALGHLLELTSGRSGGGGFSPPLTAETASALRGRWEKFLSENKAAIQAGKLIGTSEAELPSDLIPAGWIINRH